MRHLFLKRLLSLGMGAMLLFAALPSEAFCACATGNFDCCGGTAERAPETGHCGDDATQPAENTQGSCSGCSGPAAAAADGPSIGTSACRLLVAAGISIPDATVPSHETNERLASSSAPVEARISTSEDALSCTPALARSTPPERSAPRTPARLLYSTLLI